MDFGITNQQLAVICALSNGATMTQAAETAGVHRNTISNWRRNSPSFKEAFAHAQYDRALYFREKIEDCLDLAFQTLHQILADPQTPASVRLKAALAVIQTASTPPEPKKNVTLDIEKIVAKRTPAASITEDQLGPAPLVAGPVHNAAQPVPSAGVAPTSSAAVPLPPTVHNPAQTPNRRESPKIGRNDACPCGSGQKYKRCCLNKPAAPPLARAA